MLSHRGRDSKLFDHGQHDTTSKQTCISWNSEICAVAEERRKSQLHRSQGSHWCSSIYSEELGGCCEGFWGLGLVAYEACPQEEKI